MPDYSEGLYRFGGQHGYVVINNFIRAEVVELSATVEINRIEIPLVGTTRQGHKPGRETREGTFRVQKIDTYWERYVYQFLDQSLAVRRANRGTSKALQRPFNIHVWLDDPDALGAEVWELSGALLWRLPLGFSITDDILEREYPFTWEHERPLKAFEINHPLVNNPDTGFPTVAVKENTDLTSPTT